MQQKLKREKFNKDLEKCQTVKDIFNTIDRNFHIDEKIGFVKLNILIGYLSKAVDFLNLKEKQ